MKTSVVIRNCHALAEFHACVALQREIWGEEPLEVEPATMFVVAAHTGGQVIGAFAGEDLVGFVLAVAGVRAGRPYLHSHMAGVRDEYRNQGLGRKLKLFQRDEALQRGIALIEWTFDPFEVRNAHFNFRLGAICRNYLVDLYGVTTSPLHRGLRTDRLVAEWWLESPRVLQAVAAGRGYEPKGIDETVGESTAHPRISVPRNVPYGVSGSASSLGLAVETQNRIQDEFTRWFAKGYAATAVDLGDNPAYILTPHT
jgi:predicted GNAT superfamily acetyltransferase